LAHLLRKIAIFALICGAALAQEAKPFSHRLHLKLKPECTACHSAAPSSATAQDNLLPKSEACAGCHENVSIRQPTATLVTKFNHQLHAKLGNVAPVIAAAVKSKTYLSPGDLLQHLDTKNACAACHRGLGSSDAVTKAAFPKMADCLVCHNKIQPPFSCEKCHAAGVELRPASHQDTKFFDLHSSSGKMQFDRTTCAVCHGRQFNCLGCH
jgi:hypothetical protein